MRNFLYINHEPVKWTKGQAGNIGYRGPLTLLGSLRRRHPRDGRLPRRTSAYASGASAARGPRADQITMPDQATRLLGDIASMTGASR